MMNIKRANMRGIQMVTDQYWSRVTGIIIKLQTEKITLKYFEKVEDEI